MLLPAEPQNRPKKSPETAPLRYASATRRCLQDEDVIVLALRKEGTIRTRALTPLEQQHVLAKLSTATHRTAP